MSTVSTKRVVAISFIVDIIDIITNLTVALLTGSAVIFAETIQGIVDTVGSLLLIVGYKRSSHPTDQNHPFGYTREVFFWSLLSSLVMLFFGSGLTIWHGYQHVLNPEIIIHKWLALGILIVSIATNGYAFSQSLNKLSIPGIPIWQTFGESSQQLVKTALLRDSLGTVSAIIGFFSLAIYDIGGILVSDGIGAMIIGLVMIVFALILTRQARNLITGQSVPKKVIKKIRAAVETIPEVVAINHVNAIHSGSDQIFVDLDINLVKHLTTSQIEQVLDQIKYTIIRDTPQTHSVKIDLTSPTIHEEVTIERKDEATNTNSQNLPQIIDIEPVPRMRHKG